MATEAVHGAALRTVSREYGFLSFVAPAGDPLAALASQVLKNYEAEIVAEPFYEIETDIFTHLEAPVSGDPNLDDVLDLIRCPDRSSEDRGRGVTIAVIDTGIDGSRSEFSVAKRAGGWAPPGVNPWTDTNGHGTMCAAIAAASRRDGGQHQGVAPGVNLFSGKAVDSDVSPTRVFDSDLTAIYSILRSRAQAGELIVASNSFGIPGGTPPPPPLSYQTFPRALNDAINAGVLTVFSAGNNHELAGGQNDRCGPNTIWLHKSQANLLVVATCTLEGTMWRYSSRGPGQYFGQAFANRKPDVTAPTPRNGVIPYGSIDRRMPNGWGTSGACPQVAGLAALILSTRPTLSHANIFKVIGGGASQIAGMDADCQGAGIINCAQSLALAARMP